jgi:beta-N-acetylhexosaminidase
MLRSAMIAASSLALLGVGRADPRIPPFFESSSLYLPVQEESSDHRWWAPESSPDNIPQASSEDCRRYGSPNHATECAQSGRIEDDSQQERNKATPAKPPLPSKSASASKAPRHVKRLPPQPLLEQPKLLPASTHSAITGLVPAPRKGGTGRSPEERLRLMAGQILLVGFEGKQPSDPDAARVAAALHSGKLAGVVVGGANIENFSQLQRLLTVFRFENSENPPLVAIEQPGGPDAVLSEEKGFNFYASPSFVGHDRTPYHAQLLYREIAADLASLGINLNLGPSADVCTENGVDLSSLCFGMSPSRVAAYAAAFNFGHHERGVLTALLHVPFKRGWQTAPLFEQPGIALIRQVANREPGDAFVVRVRADQPIVSDKDPLGQKGVFRGSNSDQALIFDLDMGVRGAPVRYEDALVRALQAGADAVLLRDASKMQGDIAERTYEAVKAAIDSGRLQMARVEEASRHVQRLKDRLKLFQRKVLLTARSDN